MKILHTLLLGAVSLLAFAAPVRAVSEKEAIARFKVDVEKLDPVNKMKKVQQGGDPTAGVKAIRELCNQFRAVSTEGLPADLKNGYIDMLTTLTRFEKVFHGWPETMAELQEYLKARIAADPSYFQKFQTELAAINTEMQPKAAKLDELGKKYGIENLGEISGGEKK